MPPSENWGSNGAAHPLLLSLGSEGRVSGRRCQGGLLWHATGKRRCRRGALRRQVNAQGWQSLPWKPWLSGKPGRWPSSNMCAKLELHAAVEGLGALTPELQSEVAAERTAAPRRQQALTAQHRRSATTRSLPSPSSYCHVVTRERGARRGKGA